MVWLKIKKLLSNPQKLSKIPELKYWLFITGIIILIFTLFSSGDFSFLLTLSSILQCLSLLGIIIQVQVSSQNLSFNTFTIYSFIYFSRLLSIIPYESYLPNDSTGDWLYQVIEVISLGESLWIAYKLQNIKESKNFLFLVPVVLFLALIVHPVLNKNFFTDSFWMFSMMLESVAALPLLWKVKETNDLENFSSHFIAGFSVSKILSFLFWLPTYKELNKGFGKFCYFSHVSGYALMAFQLFSLVFTGNFLIYYAKSAILGTPLVLPL